MQPADPAAIRLFITDVDGTLTDGGMYYTPQGEHMKRFNTRDAKGLELLRRAGLRVAIMTQERSEIVLARAAKLKIDDVFIGVSDKLACLTQLCARLDLSPRQAAFIGDDVNDLEIMRAVGLSFAVADAVPKVLRTATVVLTRPGGHGAVREAAEWLLRVPRA
jgi:3-deoxy-D-manno-octulosonate 8-phosphate phosphatase (KDO 8-P phosphatase)